MGPIDRIAVAVVAGGLAVLLTACPDPPPEAELSCANGLDEDEDGAIDCDDPDCVDVVARAGACTNEADLALYTEMDANLEWNRCVPTCFGDVECNTPCFEENTGLSTGCSTCFAEAVECFLQNCIAPCATQPPTEECGACVDANCAPGLSTCFGSFSCPYEYGCADTFDNDDDGLVDGDDPDCQ